MDLPTAGVKAVDMDARVRGSMVGLPCVILYDQVWRAQDNPSPSPGVLVQVKQRVDSFSGRFYVLVEEDLDQSSDRTVLGHITIPEEIKKRAIKAD